MSDPCNIELGNGRYVQTTEWNGEPRIDVREWETHGDKRIPTKKGISLTLQRWKLLVEAFDGLDKALEERTNYSSHIGGNVFVGVRADSVCVDIRQYWIPPNQTDLVPCRKGICLRPGEYSKLKDTACVLGDFLPELNTCIPCIYHHQNQMSMLECAECSPNDIA